MQAKHKILSNKIFNISIRKLDFHLRIILVCVSILFIFKLFFIKEPLTIIFYTLFELGIFLLIKIIFSSKKTISKVLFFLFTFFNYTLSLINTYFLQDIIDRQYSLLNLNFGLISFFFTYTLPYKIIALFLLSLLVIYFLSKYLNIKLPVINFNLHVRYTQILNLIFILLFIFLIPLLVSGFSSPLTNTFQDLTDFNKLKLEVPNINFLKDLLNKEHIDNLDKEITKYPENNIKYDYVFVFVGETISTIDFEKSLDKDTFFSKEQEDIIYYNNYYTNAQESRTALINVLSSVFIPYSTHIYDWKEKYAEKILHKKNLVDYFNKKDYNTLFAISSIELPFIGKAYNWNKEIHFNSKEEYSSLKENYLCLHLLKNQHGCEDLALLDKIKKQVKDSNKLFLFQEFVFGHSREYMELKKQSNVDFCSNYISKFYSFLEDENILDQSLIIFVGDHGQKSLDLMKTRSNYKVPLIFINPDLSKKKNPNFYTHIDFKDLLFNNILEDYNKSINRDFAYIEGPTTSSYLTYLDSNNFILFDLKEKALLENPNKIKDINYYYNLFYAYKDYFDN